MSHYDVFNGDADGICALQQLRLAEPREAILVTGPKRDIALLERVPGRAGDSVTVLDVSLDRNRGALLRLLADGVSVAYFDHHFAGVVPQHPALASHIDTAPGVCTSMLVDRELGGRHRPWAIVAAFGDNLDRSARALARTCGLGPGELATLRDLGRAINYNGYGDSEADLPIAPAALWRALRPFADPLDFARHATALALVAARAQDMALARAIPPLARSAAGRILALPDAAWARRVQGEFANELATAEPGQAHAVLCALADGYRVSVRAPVARPTGADELCRRFPTGGGRAAAAGIDRLPREGLAVFLAAFDRAFAPAPR
ncbi:acetyltransferase [Ramlibacter sp.]|uniref:acetyltransferase n=1 Tax=Ramlibacter sp. TaxID=1917967 RepID=UPI002B5ACD16|nr:acetyltransferase [Ramlibacter sp.]HWI81133.1 acetyltransferase [Ramlibacter sp.]